MNYTVTAKLQVIVNDEQKALLHATMDAYRQGCNYVSDYVYRTHTLQQHVLHDALYLDLRTKFGLRSQMAQSVIKTVIASYKSMQTNQHGWTRAVYRKPQYDLVFNRDYSLKGEIFSVNTFQGRVKLPYISKGMEQYLDSSTWKMGTAKLVEKHGKFFLHISVTCELSECNTAEVCNVVGVDRGIRFLVAAYGTDGSTTLISGAGAEQMRAKYKQLRRELQLRGTPSARQRLKAIGQRENRWMQDVNHCVSKALVGSNPAGTLFVLEDLTGIRRATERVRRRDRYEQVSWAYYDLEQKLRYKALLAGDMVIHVDPAYTSQTCPKCGHVERGNRDKRRHVFHCENCGYESNDDRVAAMNLHRKGIDYLQSSKST